MSTLQARFPGRRRQLSPWGTEDYRTLSSGVNRPRRFGVGPGANIQPPTPNRQAVEPWRQSACWSTSSSPAATRRPVFAGRLRPGTRSGPHYPAPRFVVNGLQRVARARALTRLRRDAPTPPQPRGKLVPKPQAAQPEARRFPHRTDARRRLRPGTLRFLANSEEWREHRRAVLGDAESIPVRLLNDRSADSHGRRTSRSSPPLPTNGPYTRGPPRRCVAAGGRGGTFLTFRRLGNYGQ